MSETCKGSQLQESASWLCCTKWIWTVGQSHLGPSFFGTVWLVHSSCGTGQCVFHWKEVRWSHCYLGSLFLSFCQLLQRKWRASSGGCFAFLCCPSCCWFGKHTFLPCHQEDCGFVCVPFPVPCPTLRESWLLSIPGVEDFSPKGKLIPVRHWWKGWIMYCKVEQRILKFPLVFFFFLLSP